MNFEEFKQQLMEDLKRYLPTEVGSGVEIAENAVEKLQHESYDGITVKREDSQIGINMDAGKLYADLEQGKTYEDVFHYAVDIVQRGFDDVPKVDIAKFLDYEAMKETLTMQVIPISGNEEMLHNIPHKEVEDLAIVYRFSVAQEDIHEMAHQKLHASICADTVERQSRNSKEVEAESVAYVICQHYGINTSDYSFGYVAGWSEGKEIPELKASLNTIREAASEMITVIDNKLKDLVVDQSDIVGEKAESTKMNEVERSRNEEKPAKENTPLKRSVKKKIHEVTEKTAKVPVNKAKKKQELSVDRSR